MKNKVRLDYLTTFLEVADGGSLLSASQSLGMSVSSVSLQVSTVEEFLGAKLINRSATGVKLTQEGELAYQRIKKMFESIEDIKQDISRINSQNITIASGCAPGISILPQLDEYKLLNSKMKISVKINDATTCIDLLINGKADMAVAGYISESIDGKKYNISEIGADKLILVTEPNHELTKENTVKLADALKYPMVILNERFGISKVLTKELTDKGFPMKSLAVTAEVDSIYAQLHAVASGIGVAITSLIAAKGMEDLGLIAVKELEDFKVNRPLYLIYSASIARKPEVAAFIEFFVKKARELVENTCLKMKN